MSLYVSDRSDRAFRIVVRRYGAVYMHVDDRHDVVYLYALLPFIMVASCGYFDAIARISTLFGLTAIDRYIMTRGMLINED